MIIKKIKDVLYDTNDIIVVLAIIALAAVVISSRIGVIMEYPSTGGRIVAEAGETGGAADGAGDAVEPVGGAGGIGADGAVQDGGASEGAVEGAATGADPGRDVPVGVSDGQPAEGAPAEEVTQYSVYIEYGETAAQIAQKLLGVGLIKDKEEFYDALIAADAATRLQAGNFTIPSNATIQQIVNILTGR
jgi:hypothetical protein